jgi:hypothetical protein
MSLQYLPFTAFLLAVVYFSLPIIIDSLNTDAHGRSAYKTDINKYEEGSTVASIYSPATADSPRRRLQFEGMINENNAQAIRNRKKKAGGAGGGARAGMFTKPARSVKI